MIAVLLYICIMQRIFLDLFMNLYNDGTITVTPPAILTTTCVVNMNEFPYDKKECLLQFGRQVLWKIIK